VLRDRNRQGEHQITLAAEQALVEPLHEDDSCRDEYRREDHDIEHAHDSRRNAEQQLRNRFRIQQVVDERDENDRAVERQTGARARLPLVFQ